MTEQQSDHVVVVGGTRGLGAIVVQHFLARGARVTVLSRSRPPSLDGAQNVAHVAVDLETMAAADPIAAQVAAAGGPVRYVVFCQRYRGTADPWAGELQVSLTATRLLADAMRAHFVGEGDRALGVVSSVYADFVGASQPAGYHVAKAGVNQLVRHYAATLGANGIRANAVLPLTFLKPENEAFYRGQPELLALYEKFIPLKRIGRAEDCADLIDFLCSDRAGFITGQCIFVDGGASVLWPEHVARHLTGL